MPHPNNRGRGDTDPSASSSSSPQFPSQDPLASDDLGSTDMATLYPGLLPPLPDNAPLPDKAPSSNAATGASAAGVRALTSQAVAFYFRAPVKAFFRTRVDYLAYARALQERERELLAASISRGRGGGAGAAFSSWLRARLHATTPGVLASAVRRYGWHVLPDQVLPPLVANVGVGAVLYTSYLQVLARLHPDSGRASKRVYPPPSPGQTFAAGLVAGAIQSVVAAPLDAVQARWDVASGGGNPMRDGVAVVGRERPTSMWAFSRAKLKEIGVRGVFAGWGLSFLKDSLGSAVFFSVFEYLKAQGYYGFVTWCYGALNEDAVVLLSRKRPGPEDGRQRLRREKEEEGGPRMPTVIRPHYAIEPAFLLLAGMGASVAQQAVLHPLSHVQAEHWERLEGLDAKARKLKGEAKALETPSNSRPKWRMFRAYRDAYQTTWAECVAEAQAAGLSMRQWLYRGFWWNTIRQVPSTSAGLIIFELVRRKYGLGGDQVRINRDGYDILLN
ncbi:mitochondrial carrier domain-containing protein [Achaetomium macrosporum]|uniref:Mitochondrial carrier domain-containing protein n=1 Tax=Achaetomium macrosporum TaxID=79813 RepID=A0AAN7C6X4_9PEZI|nr:mitochondrial carrier domain-containing protein [Achaetomium macrosporum]